MAMAEDRPPMNNLEHQQLPVVYMEFAHNGKSLGFIQITLRSDLCPWTAKNFLELCRGFEFPNGRVFGYAGTVLHNVIPGLVVQGGDLSGRRGLGGTSIYGIPFPDEVTRLTHCGRGIVSMANTGRNSNNSQFMIMTAEAKHLDGRHMVFGCVTKGYDVLKAVEALGSNTGRTRGDVTIASCGIVLDFESAWTKLNVYDDFDEFRNIKWAYPCRWNYDYGKFQKLPKSQNYENKKFLDEEAERDMAKQDELRYRR